MVRLSAEETVYAVAGATTGSLIFSTKNGTYVIDGTTCREVQFQTATDPDRPQTRVVAEIDDRIWLGTTKGLFTLEGARATPRFNPPIVGVVSAIAAGEDIWIGTFNGLYRIRNGQATTFSLARGPSAPPREWIRALKLYDGELWAGSESALYRVERNGTPELMLAGVIVDELIVADGRLWIVNESEDFLNGSGYVVERDEISPIFPPKTVTTISVAEVDGEAWIATSRGVYRYNIGAPQCIEGYYGQVNTILFTEDEVWLGTSPQVVRTQKGKKAPFDSDVIELKNATRFPEVPLKAFDIHGMLSHGGHLWLWGETGLYRFEPDVDIDVHRSRTSSLFFGRLLKSQEVEVEINYTSHGIWPVCPGGSSGTFEGVVEAKSDALADRVKRKDFSSDLKTRLPYGVSRLHARARDNYNNLSRILTDDVLVIDLWMLPFLLPLILFVLWLLVAPLIILRAPWGPRARSLLRQKWIRERFTLTNRIILKWQLIARHLLRRHLAHHRANFSGEEVARDLTLHFLWDLAQYKRLALIFGDISEVKRCLEAIAGRIVRQERRLEDKALKRAIPIFLELSGTEQDYESIMAKATSRLATTTLLDETTTRSLLDTATFVFLIYDYKALTDKRSREAIDDFIQRSVADHFIVLGSREKFGLPRGVRAIQLKKIGDIWQISQRFKA